MQIYTYKECLPYLNQNRVMEEGEEDDTMFIDILRKYFDDKEEKAVKEAVEKVTKTVEKNTTKTTTYELIKEMLKNNADEEFIKKSYKNIKSRTKRNKSSNVLIK